MFTYIKKKYSERKLHFKRRKVLKTGIYARQSIEKQDSVSIEAQIEKCELLCKFNNWEYSTYSDVGYSGSNIDRPDFERLLRDIQQGKINRVIAYRLDRISRSISDFANLLTLFEKHSVQFLSATENFDTSSPIGRAMVYIVMVFAQLERETIAQRITDNYYFRAKEGFFTGGNCPFGYIPVKVDNNGKKASVLKINPDTSKVVKNIFDKFVGGSSIQKITTDLNRNHIPSPKDSSWSPTKVRRILKNPAYTPNNIDVYEYFSRLGYKIANNPDEFDGTSGLCLYGKERGKKDRKKTDISEQVLAIGRFPPLVSSETWLHVQYKLQGNKKPPRSGTSKITWLSGMLSCSMCGYSMNLKYTKKYGKEYKYIHCRGNSNRGTSVCTNNTFYNCNNLEYSIKQALFNKITSKEYHDKISLLQYNENTEFTIQKNELLSKLYSIDSEIRNFLSSIGKGNSVVDTYITQRISELDNEKKKLLSQIDLLDIKIYQENKQSLNAEYLKELSYKIIKNFDKADVETKHSMASSIIKKIRIDDSDNISIEWYV